jgi:hypothetical protein
LCVKLARWSNEDIPFILCQAGGHPDCLTQSFFYNPTAFSISNKDFVYNSVRAMYTKLDPSACPAIAANRQVLQNEVLRSQCGSVALEPIRNMLTIARSFGFDFSVLQYCIVSFGMNMFGVILGEGAFSVGPLRRLQMDEGNCEDVLLGLGKCDSPSRQEVVVTVLEFSADCI